MPSNTSRVGRTLVWLAIVLLGVSGVMGVIAGTWSNVVLAALAIAPAALLLVMGQTRRQRS